MRMPPKSRAQPRRHVPWAAAPPPLRDNAHIVVKLKYCKSPLYCHVKVTQAFGLYTTALARIRIAASGIDYWIYSHSHRNIDKTIDLGKVYT